MLSSGVVIFSLKLKADRPHLGDDPQTTTDYRHTDNHLRFVMVVVALCWWMDRQTDGRYQVHYLPASLSYAVDNSDKRITTPYTKGVLF